MTEAEWRASGEPGKMLHFLVGRPGDPLRAFCEGEVGGRKLRLFACACLHRIAHLLPDPRSRAAVEAAERFAEGQVPRAALAAAAWAADEAVVEAAAVTHDAAAKAVWEGAVAAARTADVQGAYYAARGASYFALQAVGEVEARPVVGLEERDHCRLLRCIIGTPFRPPPPLLPRWLAWEGGTVVKLARAIYDEGRFEELPVLADALEEAGCDQAELLSHLRAPGPHARGCWPVDLLLGRG